MTRISAVTLALVLGACTHQQTSNPPTTTSAIIPQSAQPIAAPEADMDIPLTFQNDPGVAATNDARVSNAIYAGLLYDRALAPLAQEVDITTTHGTVVMTGHVRSAADKEQLEQKARSTPGARTVEDRLVIGR